MLLKFINLLYPINAKNAYLTLSYIKSDNLVSEHINLEDRNFIDKLAKKWSNESKNVYFGICARKPGIEPPARGERGDLVGIPGLWLDIDILDSDVHKKKNLPDDAVAIQLIEEFGLDPTLVVNSGYGYHVWWLFDKPIWFEPGDYKRYQKLSDKFQERFLSFAKSKGYELDKTSDLPRILRLPETYNYKKYTPKKVTLLIDDGPRYSITSLEDKFLDFNIEPINTENYSDKLDILIKRLKKTKKLESKELMSKVLKGEPLAEEGARDNKLQQAVSVIAFTEVDLDIPADILVDNILMASINAMAQTATIFNNPPPNRSNCINKMVRAKAQAKEAKEEENRFEREARDILAKSVRKNNSIDSDYNLSFLYTKKDLEKFAEQQKCTVQELEKRWIAQFGSAYFVYFEGQYRGPFIREALPVTLRDFLLPVEYIQLKTLTKEGTMRSKTPAEIIELHGIGVEKAVAHLNLKYSFFDKNDRVFHEAVCPLNENLKSEYNEQIDTWLKLLGGDTREKFLDWLATVTLLDRPSCALYLSGARSTGKSMLTKGIASIWGTTTPTELSRILDSFNGDLTRCPLVVADEHIPQNVGNRRNTAELRDLIAQTSRTLSRKYMPNIELNGAIRLMICANNDRLLSMGDEDLGQEDLQAVADRFLLIKVDDKAAAYLKAIGGMEGTKDWVTGGKIARHLLWLKENRIVIPGSRFWVEGQTTQMHKSLATQGTIANLIMEWLAKYFTTNQTQANMINGVFVGGGYICVNTMAVKDNWLMYLPDSNRVPTAARIGRTLSNISKGEVHLKDKKGILNRHHIIDAETLLNWINENQAGNIGEVAARIMRPVELSEALTKREPSLGVHSIYMNEISSDYKAQGVFN